MDPNSCSSSVEAIAGCLARVIFNPLLALIFAAGLVVFIWGLVQYLYDLNVKGEPSSDGKSHMFWGMVGMFIMAAAFTIINIIANTIGAKLPAGY